MTETTQSLNDAQNAVEQAMQQEAALNTEMAESYWRDAEWLYEEAGVDPEWFDTHGLAVALKDAFGDQADMLTIRGLMFDGRVELTDSPDETVTGIVAEPSAVVPIEQ